MENNKTIKFGLIGNPVRHSTSPHYFNSKFNCENINARYEAYQLDSANELIGLINKEPMLTGLNVTSPFKTDVIPFIDILTEEAQLVNSVNTIFIDRTQSGKNGNFKLSGHNSDVDGFKILLKELNFDFKKNQHLPALVFGNGGGARAAVAALLSINAKPKIISRNKTQNSFFMNVDILTYEELNEELISKSAILVNATPLGMTGAKIHQCVEIPYEAITSTAFCIDLIYNPPVTHFLSRCSHNGAAIKNGLSMLIGQAESSWRFWLNQLHQLEKGV